MTCTAVTSDHLQTFLEKPESYRMTKGCEGMFFEVLAILRVIVYNVNVITHNFCYLLEQSLKMWEFLYIS